MKKRLWPKLIVLDLDRTELDLIEAALDAYSSFVEPSIIDAVGSKLIEAWNEGIDIKQDK